MERQRGTEQSRREGQWRSVNKWLNNNKYTNIYTYECHNEAFICKLIKSNQCCGGGGCRGREGHVGSGADRRMVLSLLNGTTLPRLGRWATRPTWTTQLDLNWRGRWEGIRAVGGNGAGEVGGEKQQSKMNLNIPSRNLSLCKLIKNSHKTKIQ